MTLRAPEHRLIDVGSLRLHVVQAGPVAGKPVVLLHGFPDLWIGWRHQMDAFATAGFRVIVPDQRGYNTSEKPKGIHEYTLDKLLGDLVGLADALRLERFHLVGHDWGGIVAARSGRQLPTRFGANARITALSGQPVRFSYLECDTGLAEPFRKRSPAQREKDNFLPP